MSKLISDASATASTIFVIRFLNVFSSCFSLVFFFPKFATFWLVSVRANVQEQRFCAFHFGSSPSLLCKSLRVLVTSIYEITFSFERNHFPFIISLIKHDFIWTQLELKPEVQLVMFIEATNITIQVYTVTTWLVPCCSPEIPCMCYTRVCYVCVCYTLVCCVTDLHVDGFLSTQCTLYYIASSIPEHNQFNHHSRIRA